MDDRNRRSATIEEEWLRRHDPHIYEFAQEIGARVEANTDGRSSRRLVRQHRGGALREIWIIAQEGQGIRIEVRASVAVSEQKGQLCWWVAAGVPNRWDNIGPLLERAWRQARRFSKNRILQVVKNRELGWCPRVFLGPEFTGPGCDNLRDLFHRQQRKARLERVLLIAHDPQFEAFARKHRAVLERNRGYSPSRYFVLDMGDEVTRHICVQPVGDPGAPGPVPPLYGLSAKFR